MKRQIISILLLCTPVVTWAQDKTLTAVDTTAVRPFVENPLGLLDGKIAGLEVISSAGVPGLKPMMWMRGVRLHESMAPMYIVDGMRVDDISLLSPDDVASIEVCTDMARCLSYGSEAAYGTIIVRTRGARQEGFHAGYGFHGGMEWLRTKAEEASEVSSTSFLGKHHLFLQYDHKWLSARTSFSFLDNDGPFTGRGDAFRRFSGVWNVEAHPWKWFRAGTSGTWGTGRADFLTEQNFKSFQEGLWSKWKNLVQTSVRVWAEFTPLDCLYLRPYFDYSRRKENGTSVAWYIWEGQRGSGSFRDEGSSWKDGGIEGGYSHIFASVHRVALDAGYRRVLYAPYRQQFDAWYDEKYKGGFVWKDNAGFAETGRAEFEERMGLSLLEFMTHIPGEDEFHINASRANSLRYVWNDVSPSLSYQWLGRYDLQAGIVLRWGKQYGAEFLSFSPAVTLGWTLTGEPWLRRTLPDWVEKIAVQASWGQTTSLPIIMSSAPLGNHSVYYIRPNALYTAFDAVSPYIVSSARRSLHSELFLKGGGSWQLSADWFISDDALLSPGSTEDIIRVRNEGVGLTGNWSLNAGDWRFAAGATVSIYANRVMNQAVDSHQYTRYTNTVNGRSICIPAAEYVAGVEGGLDKDVFPSFTYYPLLQVSWRDLSFTAAGSGTEGNYIGATVLSSQNSVDASYFRLRQLSLAYNLPQKWVRRLRMSGVRLSVSLEDALLFTKYEGPSDPLFSLLGGDGFGVDTKTYPSAARLVFGVSVNL